VPGYQVDESVREMKRGPVGGPGPRGGEVLEAGLGRVVKSNDNF